MTSEAFPKKGCAEPGRVLHGQPEEAVFAYDFKEIAAHARADSGGKRLLKVEWKSNVFYVGVEKTMEPFSTLLRCHNCVENRQVLEQMQSRLVKSLEFYNRLRNRRPALCTGFAILLYNNEMAEYVRIASRRDRLLNVALVSGL